MAQLGVIVIQIEATENTARQQPVQHFARRARQSQYCFVEHRPIENPADPRHLRQSLHQYAGIGMTGGGNLLQAARTQQRQIKRGGGYHQALIGADVGRGLGSTDVLLARLQGQGKTGLAVQIDGAAHQAAGHLPHPFPPAAQKAEVGTAGRQRRTEWLTIAAGDVGASVAPFAGRFENRQCGGVDHRHRQCVVLVRPIGQCVHVLQHPEKIGLRDDQRREILSGVGGERLDRRVAPGWIVGHLHQFDALIVHDGMRGPPV